MKKSKMKSPVKALKEKYTREVHMEFLSRFQADSHDTSKLESTESLVFEYRRCARPHILKVASKRQRSMDSILAEVEWVNFLAANGVGACRAVTSAAGNHVETIGKGADEMLAVSFEKAPGGFADENMDIAELAPMMGRTLGKIHRVSRNFSFSRPEYGTIGWFDCFTPAELESFLAPGDAHILDMYFALRENIDNLPKDKDSYGLIHGDFHPDNFYLHKRKIWLFDFECFEYAHFIYDISITTYYCRQHAKGLEGRDALAAFLSPFLSGYLRENKLDRKWLAYIPEFLKLHKIILYIDVYRTLGVEGVKARYNNFASTARKHILSGTASIGGGLVVNDFNPHEIAP